MLNAYAIDKKVQVLSVFLEEHVFGIPILQIQDVLKPLQMTSVPLAPKHIRGVCNLRGRIVTVIDLRERIALPGEVSNENMNVVIDSDGELYSILADRVGDVLTLDESEIEEAPRTLLPSWQEVCLGVHQMDGSIMVILDVHKIIHENPK